MQDRVDGRAIAASAVPLTGGYGGQTYAVSAGGEDAVLKLYVKDPERAAVDAALLRLVHGLLPVPRVLDAMPERDGSPEDSAVPAERAAARREPAGLSRDGR